MNAPALTSHDRSFVLAAATSIATTALLAGFQTHPGKVIAELNRLHLQADQLENHLRRRYTRGKRK